MVSILGITDSDAVRAAIGIAEESGELNDSVFTDLRLASLLAADLRGWLPIPYAEILDDPEAEIEETDSELRVILLNGYATYWCAEALMLSGEISFALRHEDGQNKMVRRSFDQDALMQRFEARYLRYKNQLLELLAPPPADSTAWFVGASRPAYDPVTAAMR